MNNTLLEDNPMMGIMEGIKTLTVPDNSYLFTHYIKHGRLYFVEQKIFIENDINITHQIMAFRQLRTEIERSHHVFSNRDAVDIPPQFNSLIAALTQDSDEPLDILVSRINNILSPFIRHEEMCQKFIKGISTVIQRVAMPICYGLDDIIFSTLQINPRNKHHFTIVRWEVNDINYLPSNVQPVITQRRINRVEMSKHFSLLVTSLPRHEQEALLLGTETVNIMANAMENASRKKIEEEKKKEELKRMEEKVKREEERKRKEEEKRRKEEEKAKRDEDKVKREEERRKREEERRLKEEERKKLKEDERRLKEEKKKKEHSQLLLTSLFSKSPAENKSTHQSHLVEISHDSSPLFPPFFVKENITLYGPSLYNTNDTTFINTLKSYQCTNNRPPIDKQAFLSELRKESKKKRGVQIQLDVRTLLLPGSADILHVPNVKLALRMKLLQFAEDVRPAYYGTITRKSNSISATDPFAKDSDLIDYDMDSEAEWEPEGEGEDIHSGDEDEDDTAIELDNSEDAGWLVPEGYLSENEGGEDNDGRKIHRKNSSTKRTFIRKIVLGPYFEGESEGGEAMKPFEAQFFLDDMQEAYDPFKKDVVIKTPCSVAAPVINVSKSEFTEVHTNALIDLINVKPSDSIPHLLTEAKSNMLLQNISKRQLEAKIKNIAVKEKRGADTRSAWYVKEPNSS